MEKPASIRVLRVYSERAPCPACPAASLTGMATGENLDGGGNVLVEEISEDGHLEDVVGGELGTGSVLSVVSSDSSKIWDGLLVSVDDEVLVDSGINNGNNLSLNLLDYKWDNGGLEEWDEYGSNLGNEGSRKGDIEII